MTKDELRLLIEAETAKYDKPVYTYAESFDQEKRLKDRIKAAQGLVIPKDLKRADYHDQLEQTRQGKYQHKPGHDIWLTEFVPGTGKMRYELED